MQIIHAPGNDSLGGELIHSGAGGHGWTRTSAENGKRKQNEKHTGRLATPELRVTATRLGIFPRWPLDGGKKELEMRTTDARQDLEVRAAAALKAALAEVSTIKVREIRSASSDLGHDRSFMAYVDVFGHRHALACEVQADGQPGHVRTALEGLRNGTSRCSGDAMPVIIAPYLSPEAQQLCKENKAGYVDLEGNARLALGEVFIVKRTLPRREHHRPAAAVWPLSHGASDKFPVATTTTRPAALRHAEA